MSSFYVYLNFGVMVLILKNATLNQLDCIMNWAKNVMKGLHITQAVHSISVS